MDKGTRKYEELAKVVSRKVPVKGKRNWSLKRLLWEREKGPLRSKC